MRKVFFGHRGVGKTSLLRRHESYFPSVPHFDLDQVISETENESVIEIFQQQGEIEFRKLEQKYFFHLLGAHPNLVLSVGAGFDVSTIPIDIERIFISRTTDAEGRIFLDRPRLNHDLAPLEEYQLRYHQRNSKFQNHCHWIYDLPEGIRNSDVENLIFKEKAKAQTAYLTVSSQDLKHWQLLNCHFSAIEIKDDTLEELHSLQDGIKKFKKILFSYRKPNFESWPILKMIFETKESGQTLDLDLDESLFSILSGTKYADLKSFVSIVSSHANDIAENIQRLQTAQNEFRSSGSKNFTQLHFKCCPLISTFEELIQGDAWMMADPANRSFLPRSSDGRWVWYRLYRSAQLKLNFVKGSTRFSDQPSLHQFLEIESLQQNKEIENWAAVIGSPVYFSRSPEFHRHYFNSKKSALLAIQIQEAEFEKALTWLSKNNFSWLAVTAPLKILAFQKCQISTESAKELGSVNTLAYWSSKNIWSGENTDLPGFEKLIETAGLDGSEHVGIWGGTGTLSMMKKVLPKAISLSSRTGAFKGTVETKDLTSDVMQSIGERVDTLIWAAPRHLETKMPPLHWPIQKVIDLNYRENSVGREFVQNLNSRRPQIQYFSGLEMFEKQGEAQQKFWSENEPK